MKRNIRITRADEKDLPKIRSLLLKCDLPVADIRSEILFLKATGENKLIGCIGLEIYGDAGLLRSLAVEPASQNFKIGTALLRKLIEQSKNKEVRELYLLTTTAESFFKRYDFTVVVRDKVPIAIRETAEFKEICPASATVMRLDL